jgi:acetyl-CoA C-acetyltransferase
MDRPVIVSALRTPVGNFGGALKDISAPQLAAHAVRAALERIDLPADAVDEVLLGCVLQAGLGQNPARQAALAAGIPNEVPATTVNMLCGSGLKSVALAAQAIRAGDADIVVAGGMESMSRAPYLVPAVRFGARLGDATLIDSMVHDGLTDAFHDIHMGITAENVAEQFGITREDQDAFAAASQQKAARALDAGVFRDEIVPIRVPHARGDRVVDTDESPRAGTTIEALARLRTAFRAEDGTVTAGNASGLNDGAAALVLMSARRAAELGLEPFGSVESHASVGLDPTIMGLGPVPAVRAALARAGLSLSDIDLFELNEAFAAQSLAVIRELGLEAERVNPHGGAIALGHPIGASGGRILVSLLHQMRRTNAGRGVAALCVGGGQGQAAVIRNGAHRPVASGRSRPRALRSRRTTTASTDCDTGPATAPRPTRGT